ncbi:fibrobacter succinogenes major paralogous domain-containing protein [Candidatus Saccharibacteria bacterium]|nr:fibrobacter succinogenes major paralogous domain-containing protein [Candidatus Saccharibacteria bacterium]
MILFRSYRNRILLASLALALFGAIQASFILPASTISEENVDVNVNLVNGVAIRILNSAATAEITELDLSATAAPTGTFVTDNFKVEVSTANKTGYKLYMNSSYQNPSTSTYTTDLVNQTNTSYTIPTVAAATTKADLSTAAPGTTNANKWAYSLDDATYSPVPVNSAPTQIDSHDTPTAGTKTPVYIGMNVNVEKPSGVYKNQLTFSAVGNPVPTDYSLYFEPGGTGVSGLPQTMTYSGVASSYTFTIPSAAPTRDGYGFTGYSDGSTTYQPGDTITIVGDIDYTGTATLTAQWEQNFWTITTMQQMTTAICNTVYTPSNATGSAVTVISDRATYEATATADNQPYVAQSTLRDVRDDNTYVVRKLADGNCWMTENLKLTGPTSDSRRLYPADTDITVTYWDLPAVNTDFGTSCSDTAKNMLAGGSDSYGVYYNWYAATAGTGTCSMSSGNATSSICPRGWKLPTGSSSGEFQALYDEYSSSSAMLGSPVNFVLSGRRGGSSTLYQGSYGYYWSSTAYNSDSAYRLYLNSSDVSPADGSNKYYGLTVRCVAR